MGHIEVVSLLLKRGANFKREESNLLRIACEHNQIMELFISQGFDINVENGYTLAAAVSKANADLFRMLFRHGIDVTAHGSTALNLAKEQKREDIFQLLVENGAKPITEEYKKLILAAKTGDYEAMTVLLAQKVDCNMNGPDGRAARVASNGNHTEIVELLLGYGLDLTRETNEGLFKAPLKQKNLVLVKLLLANGAPIVTARYSILSKASKMGDLELLILLMDANKYNQVDERPERRSRKYLLRSAIQHNHLQVVQFWLDQGALLDADDTERASVLKIALENGHLEIAEFLMEYGIDLDLQDCKYHAFVSAARWGHTHVVEYLLDKGLDIDVFECGFKALLLACCEKRSDVLQVLIRRGVKPNSDVMSSILFRCTKYYGDKNIENILNAAGFKDNSSIDGHNSLFRVGWDQYNDAESFAKLPSDLTIRCFVRASH
jgi:ankyrin repeat protein